MNPGKWLEWTWLLPELPQFRFSRRPDRIHVWLTSPRRTVIAGAGLIRDGGVWIGDGSKGISLLCGSAHAHVKTFHRKGRKWVGKRLGLYVGEDF